MIKAISDLHLSLSNPDKDMAVFGASWHNYMMRLQNNWENSVNESDIILVAGDISWAMKSEAMHLDRQFLFDLPGTKILIKGNHDYWASGSITKTRRVLPDNCFMLNRDYFLCEKEGIAIAGTRLWSSSSIKISSSIFEKKHPETLVDSIQDKKIFKREKERLEHALRQIPSHIKQRIVMTHFPPIGTDRKDNEITCLLQQYEVSHCVFGHLHGLCSNEFKDFIVKGIHYHLVAADYINFTPIDICVGNL